MDNAEALADGLEIERRLGHPQEMWDEISRRVQEDAVTRWDAVEVDWLRLMWAMDAFRVAGLVPRGMGNPNVMPQRRLDAVYRVSKGNWFASLIALLLQNQTNQVIRARTRVRGFSQFHQIDLAWPAREIDPLVCIETKVTGAPGFGDTPSRGAMSDFSNRRKELKFAATDLKLFRRQQETVIEHWGVWRSMAPPKTYFLWAARLREAPKLDVLESLVIQARALVDSYLDGAGIVAWTVGDGGYETVSVPPNAQVASLDDVIYRVATEIRSSLTPSGRPPAPVRPEREEINVAEADQSLTDAG